MKYVDKDKKLWIIKDIAKYKKMATCSCILSESRSWILFGPRCSSVDGEWILSLESFHKLFLHGHIYDETEFILEEKSFRAKF